MTAPESYGPLQQVRAVELRPGDGLTFGDHTGWYRVRSVQRDRGSWVVVRSWWRRKRTVLASTWVWVRR